MIQHFNFIRFKIQLTLNPGIPFNQFVCGKPQRKICLLGVVLNQMNDRMETAMHRTAVIVLITEVLPQRTFLVFGHMDRMPDQLIHALVLCGGDRNDRHPQHVLHGVDIYRAAVGIDLIHHVEGNNHRHIHFQQLHRQIQIALDIGRIDDIDDAVGLFLQHKVPRYQFFTGIRRHGINTRQVGDLCI